MQQFNGVNTIPQGMSAIPQGMSAIPQGMTASLQSMNAMVQWGEQNSAGYECNGSQCIASTVGG